VRLWDPKSGAGLSTLLTGAAVTAMGVMKVEGVQYAFLGSWSSTGVLQVRVDSGLVQNSLRSGTPGSWITSIAPGKDDRTLFTASSDGGVYIWDIPTRKRVKVLRHPEGVSIAHIAATADALFSSGSDGLVRKWALDGEAVTLTLEVDTERAPSIALATIATGKGDARAETTCIVAGCCDGTIKVYNAENGDMVNTFGGHAAAIEAIAVEQRPRSAMIFAADEEQVLEMQGAAAELGRELSDEDMMLEGGVVYSACTDGLVHAWDLSTLGGTHEWAQPPPAPEAKPQHTQAQLAERDLRVRTALAGLDKLRGIEPSSRTIDSGVGKDFGFERQLRGVFVAFDKDGKGNAPGAHVKDVVRKYAPSHEIWSKFLLDIDCKGLKEVGEQYFVDTFVRFAAEEVDLLLAQAGLDSQAALDKAEGKAEVLRQFEILIENQKQSK